LVKRGTGASPAGSLRVSLNSLFFYPPRLGDQRGLKTSFETGPVGFAAMTEHGPPRTVLDSRLRGNDRISAAGCCRGFGGVRKGLIHQAPTFHSLPRLGDQRGLKTSFETGSVGFAAMTEHGPPRTVLDSRLRGNDRISAAGCCRGFGGVPQFSFHSPPRLGDQRGLKTSFETGSVGFAPLYPPYN